MCSVGQTQAEPIRVAYKRIRCYADLIPDLFWPIRTRVTRVTSRGQPHTEWDNKIKERDVDLQGDNKRKESVIGRSPGPVIWRSHLWPRNTGMDA